MSLFVGRLPTHNFDDRDLEDLFYKYGKIVNCKIKKGSRFAFGFVEFEDSEDAYDAIKNIDGLNIDGTRIVVEKAKGSNRKNDTSCYNCGEEGHWARDCRRSKRTDRYSRSPDRYSSRRRNYRSHSRPRSPYERCGRSYSRSRSPSPRARSRSSRRYYSSRSRSSKRNHSHSLSPKRHDSNRNRSYSRSISPGTKHEQVHLDSTQPTETMEQQSNV